MPHTKPRDRDMSVSEINWEELEAIAQEHKSRIISWEPWEDEIILRFEEKYGRAGVIAALNSERERRGLAIRTPAMIDGRREYLRRTGKL